MKITDCETFLLRVPLKKPIADSIQKVRQVEMVVLKVTTSSGLEGWGFNWTLGTGGSIAKDMLDQYLVPGIRGADPAFRRRLQDEIYSSNVLLWDQRLGQVGVAQIGMAAVDMALWDITCKQAGLPLWKLLGGYRERVEAYNTDVGWLSWSTDELVRNIRRAVRQGFRGVKVKVGLPDPMEDYRRVAEVRAAVGEKVKVMVDANTAWDVNTSIKWGARLEDHDIFWLEEPISPLDISGHAAIAARLRTPVAVGETIYSKYTFRQYIDQSACGVVQADCTRLTGISEWLEVAALASARNLPIVPHTNIQYPVHVQLAAATPNATMVEYVPWCLEVWKEPVVMEGGFFHVPTKPGLNTEIKPSMIEEYSVGPGPRRA